MRVYKFLNAEFALKDVREHRIKIAEIWDLNDPFELIPFDLSDGRIRLAMEMTRDDLNKTHGLICFSAKYSNPVLWSHYADNHKGICLEFDVAEDIYVKAVTYIKNRLPFPESELDEKLTAQMLFTKFDAWQYEEEVRVWAH